MCILEQEQYTSSESAKKNTPHLKCSGSTSGHAWREREREPWPGLARRIGISPTTKVYKAMSKFQSWRLSSRPQIMQSSPFPFKGRAGNGPPPPFPELCKMQMQQDPRTSHAEVCDTVECCSGNAASLSHCHFFAPLRYPHATGHS